MSIILAFGYLLCQKTLLNYLYVEGFTNTVSVETTTSPSKKKDTEKKKNIWSI